MSRRHRAVKKVIMPDYKYNSINVTCLVNKTMRVGKKSVAEHIVYTAFQRIQQKLKQDPLQVFEKALNNITPLLETRSRRIGGSTYQIPIEVSKSRGKSLGIRWLLTSARKRSKKSMIESLATELIDAANNTGNAVKIKEEKYKMAEANKALVHFRW